MEMVGPLDTLEREDILPGEFGKSANLGLGRLAAEVHQETAE